MDLAIRAEGLVKRFGGTTALDGVDLGVRAGTVRGLLGPNGAGKTTVVRILATLTPPDGGTAAVGGHEVVRDAHDVRKLIGLTGQYAAVDEPTTGLDPRARTELWTLTRRLVADGVTVLLTTQYLDEADALADEITVIDHGRVVAAGTPDELRARTGSRTLDDVFLSLTGPRP